MKTIGLIGGLSWQSSAHYYRIINSETARLRGGLHSAPILLHSLDFAPIAQLQADHDWQGAGDILAQAASGLQCAGAGLIGIASNTMHMVAPKVQSAIDIPLVHIAHPTAEQLRKDGFDTVGLLGTRFTLEMDFYTNELENRGLKPLVPEIGITDLNAIIYEELCRGIVRERSRQTYIDAINRLALRGAEAVVLGCTEISMLIDDDASPLPTYDTADLHAKALVKAALA